VIPLADDQPTRRTPVVTIGLIVANVAVWFFYELPNTDAAILRASFYPCSVDIGHACPTVQPWGLSWISAMFLHASWTHILGNMLFLAIFGNNVEDALGRRGFAAFYFAGGFVAAMTQAAVTLLFGTAGDARVPMLGASGAVAAVLGAYFVLYPRAGVRTLVLWFPVRIPAFVYLGAWFGYQFIQGNSGLLNPGRDGGVAFFAHIGGFVFGLVVTKILAITGRLAVPAGAAR
jgi:membrane associated rhomboid family serine protease